MKRHPWGDVSVQLKTLSDELPVRHSTENVFLAVYHNLGNVGKPYLSKNSVNPVFAKRMYEHCCGHIVKNCESTKVSEIIKI